MSTHCVLFILLFTCRVDPTDLYQKIDHIYGEIWMPIYLTTYQTYAVMSIMLLLFIVYAQ